MPIYEQSCQRCNIQFEVLIIGPLGDRVIVCPQCGGDKLERLISLCAFKMTSPIYGSYRGPCANTFENFTLHNAPRDKNGKKIVVNSLKELRQKEKELHFSLDIASEDRAEAKEAPQHEAHAGDITHGYQWNWAKDPVRRAKSMASPIVKLDVGVARSQKETLAGRD
jgi:putative FmdB family regulatory protein